MYIQKGLTKLVKPLLSILFSHPLVYFFLEDQLSSLPHQLLAISCRGMPAESSFMSLLQKTKKRPNLTIKPLFFVGILRLERRTPCSQSRCASQLRHIPKADAKVDIFFLKQNFFCLNRKFLYLCTPKRKDW